MSLFLKKFDSEKLLLKHINNCYTALLKRKLILCGGEDR